MTKQIVIESLKVTMKKLKQLNKKITKEYLKSNNIIMHQDQGSQYTSYNYTELVMKAFTLSYSNKATPTENAAQESFFGRFKVENRKTINNIEKKEEVIEYIQDRLNYYNNKRLHSSIGYTTPKEATYKFIKNLT